MRSKRYEFSRSDGVIWTLVYEGDSGQWHIEKRGACGEPARLTLSEFENTEHGRKLRPQLADAVRQAEADA